MAPVGRPAPSRTAGGRRPTRPAPRSTVAARVLGTSDASLLDVVDNVLSKGVVLTGDLTLALADVDLVYLRLSVLLCAADRALPAGEGGAATRRRTRRART
jgi:hypothetical protein